jgi:uncharacterized protein (TIGR03118 family)
MQNKLPRISLRGVRNTALCLLAASLSFNAFAQGKDPSHEFTETKLVSSVPGLAAVHDPNLVNAWGLARSSGSPWWVADNGTGLATLYDGAGAIQKLVVTIPPSDPKSPKGSPTGIMFNGDPGSFLLAPGKPALFIFVTEDGTISGWNPKVMPTSAVIVQNFKTASVFKGATIATASLTGHKRGSFLYVTDFRQGVVQIYDNAFKPAGSFGAATDGDAGFAPFNVQNIGGNLYVTYAKQDAAKHDEVGGPGFGFVKVYSPEGKLLHQLARGNFFNAPWGITLAPSDFGAYSHNILVGQLRSGTIQTFDAVTGEFRGTLRDKTDTPIVIEGLWALSTGSGVTSGPATAVFFAAGINFYQDGLFGMLTAVNNPQGNDR